MKNCHGLKRMLSIMLICTMFLPGVSAYYDLKALGSNGERNTKRYPLYGGTRVTMGGGMSGKKRYSQQYSNYLRDHASDVQSRCSSDFSRNVYEEELRHVAACAYVTATHLNFNDDSSIEFSKGVVRLCKIIVGLPGKFNESLMLFAVNYTYSLLGALYENGNPEKLNTTKLKEFSDAACRGTSAFCRKSKEPYMQKIDVDVVNQCLLGN